MHRRYNKILILASTVVAFILAIITLAQRASAEMTSEIMYKDVVISYYLTKTDQGISFRQLLTRLRGDTQVTHFAIKTDSEIFRKVHKELSSITKYKEMSDLLPQSNDIANNRFWVINTKNTPRSCILIDFKLTEVYPECAIYHRSRCSLIGYKDKHTKFAAISKHKSILYREGNPVIKLYSSLANDYAIFSSKSGYKMLSRCKIYSLNMINNLSLAKIHVNEDSGVYIIYEISHDDSIKQIASVKANKYTDDLSLNE